MKNTKTSSPALPVERSEAERSEDERGATGGDRGIAGRPNPEVVSSAKRRSFTAAYKQRILSEADRAKEESGGIGALLRREGLYSSHLVTWRQERPTPRSSPTRKGLDVPTHGVEVFAGAHHPRVASPPIASSHITTMILPSHGATHRVVMGPEDGLVEDMILLKPIPTSLPYGVKSAGKPKLICTTPATIPGAAPAYRTSAYSSLFTKTKQQL